MTTATMTDVTGRQCTWTGEKFEGDEVMVDMATMMWSHYDEDLPSYIPLPGRLRELAAFYGWEIEVEEDEPPLPEDAVP